MTDMAAVPGEQEEWENQSALIDAGEAGTVYDGCALQMETTGTVKIWAGGNYCGIARIEKGTSAGVATAVAGERVTILKTGQHFVTDSEDDVLAIGDPVKPMGTAGKYRKWVESDKDTNNDSQLLLAGFVVRVKDANKQILIRTCGGGR